jgi:hypothetical protein
MNEISDLLKKQLAIFIEHDIILLIYLWKGRYTV